MSARRPLGFVTYDRPVTRCPSCGRENELATSVFEGRREPPNDGEVSLCAGCGAAAFFDTRASGGLRKMTPEEMAAVFSDPDAAAAHKALLLAIASRRR